jgi:hypothetical protein
MDFHPFEVGPDSYVDAGGRRRLQCRVCTLPANARRHTSPEVERARNAHRKETLDARRATAGPTIQRITATAERLHGRPSIPTPPRIEPKAPTVRVADWRLTVLRQAIEQALAAELSLPLRLQLLDAQRALRSDLHGTVAVAGSAVELAPPADPDGPPLRAEPARGSLASLPVPSPETPGRPSDARRVARAFRGDKYRELFLRAVDAGWPFVPLANGHVRIIGPGGTVSLSMTAQAGHGHGYANVRATAKRAGLDVSGL